MNLWLAKSSGPKFTASKMFLMVGSWVVQEDGIHGMPELLGLVHELAWVVEGADDCSSRYCLASPL
jgi:hypothetical protein